MTGLSLWRHRQRRRRGKQQCALVISWLTLTTIIIVSLLLPPPPAAHAFTTMCRPSIPPCYLKNPFLQQSWISPSLSRRHLRDQFRSLSDAKGSQHPAEHNDDDDPIEEEEKKVSGLQASGSLEKDDNDGDQNTLPPPPFITKEMFLRDMLQDPQVLKKKKKKQGGGYQPMDNRDHLPFVVQVMTPDPYTKRQVLQEKARQRTKEEKSKKQQQQQQQQQKKSNNNNNNKSPLPILPSSAAAANIASSLQLQQMDGSTQILGEFALDKSTTTGDWILIGQVEYQVTSAKCQYKYAGGKRFVMIRKILQVKEVRRVEQEAQLLRQLQASPPSLQDDDDGDGIVMLD